MNNLKKELSEANHELLGYKADLVLLRAELKDNHDRLQKSATVYNNEMSLEMTKLRDELYELKHDLAGRVGGKHNDGTKRVQKRRVQKRRKAKTVANKVIKSRI